MGKLLTPIKKALFDFSVSVLNGTLSPLGELFLCVLYLAVLSGIGLIMFWAVLQ